MLITAVAFLAGASALHALPALPAGPMIALAVTVATLFALGRHRSPRRPAAMVFAALALGFAWAWLAAAHRLALDLPPALEGRDLDLRGYVATLPERRGFDVRFEFVPTSREAFIPGRVLLTWYDTAVVPAPGEAWHLRVRLKRRRGFANPGSFDYEAALLRDEIGASGYVKADLGDGPIAAAAGRYWLLRLRAWFSEQLALQLAGRPYSGVLTGLVTGDRRGITTDQWSVFAATGTSHLMAISGLHIGLAAAIGAGLGRSLIRLPMAQRRRWSAASAQAVCAILTGTAYAALAGFSIPTQRALAMLAALVLAQGLRREIRCARGLALALVAVLCIDPFAPLSAGFWLSFGAVAAIAWTLIGRLRRPASLAGLVRVQCAVGIGLAPILISVFGQVSLVAPFVNLVAVPLFTLLVVPIALLGAVVLPLWPAAAGLLLRADHQLLEWSWPALEFAARLPVALWWLPSLPLWALAMMAMGAALLVGPGIAASRLLGVALCLPGLAALPPTPTLGAFELAVLDVGQGLAAVVRTRTRVLVYDVGPGFRGGSDAGRLVVVPFLRHAGIRSIDRLVLSHGDLDHVGGAATLLREVPVHDVLGGPSVGLPGARARPCRRGEHWTWDEVSFTVVHPGPGGNLADNDGSCVLMVQGAGGSVLLPGDVEVAGEHETLARGVVPRVDVVVAPHHGSATSSTPEFVDATRPRFVIFTAGQSNRWGFPRPDIVERWRAAGAVPYGTATSGAILVSVHVDGIDAPREYRSAQRRYWHGR